MFTLTYDLWREIVEDVVISHQPLFESMHQAAEDLDLTTALIEELKRQEELPLPGDMDFKLVIDFFQDEIEGFIIFLAAEEPQELLARLMADATEERGFSLKEMQAFELEHGLNMQEEILVEMEETYGIQAEVWGGPADLLPGFIRQPGYRRQPGQRAGLAGRCGKLREIEIFVQE